LQAQTQKNKVCLLATW